MNSATHTLDFVIVGAQKSASTFLHHTLSAHPEIGMPKNETVAFIREPYSVAARDEMIEAQMTGRWARINGIKRPDYLPSTTVASRLHAYNPNPKILMILRNPMARAVSAYYHLVRSGALPLLHHEKGLRQILSSGVAYGGELGQTVLSYGLYSAQVKAYQDRFRNENVLIMFQDDFKKHSREILKKAYLFVGYENVEFFPSSLEKTRPQASTSDLRELYFQRKVQRIYKKYNRKRADNPQLEETWIDAFRIRLWSAVNASLSRVLGTKPNSQLSEDPEAQLRAYYRADLDILAQNLGDIPEPWRVYTTVICS